MLYPFLYTQKDTAHLEVHADAQPDLLQQPAAPPAQVGADQQGGHAVGAPHRPLQLGGGVGADVGGVDACLGKGALRGGSSGQKQQWQGSKGHTSAIEGQGRRVGWQQRDEQTGEHSCVHVGAANRLRDTGRNAARSIKDRLLASRSYASRRPSAAAAKASRLGMASAQVPCLVYSYTQKCSSARWV